LHLYAESSAVAAWLFREPRGPEVERDIAAASHVVTSDLTLVEFDRALFRAIASGRVDPAGAAAIRSRFDSSAASWDVLNLLPSIVERARQPFPYEPIRSLDALHVSWALHVRAAIPDLAILSLDDRIRRVAASVGLASLPN
jgi:hypothetical protein